MNRLTFNPDQIRQLEANLHVAFVSDRTIQYKGEFKIHAVRENLAGKRPIQIFEERGFDLDMIGKKRPNEALKRWRKIYRIYGEEGLLNEKSKNHQDRMAQFREAKTHDCRIPRSHLSSIPFHCLNNQY